MPKQNKLLPVDFTNAPEMLACIKELKKTFGDNYERLNISDTVDDEGHQYVNLVQKGGGVLGIALVGYTYVLEQVGVRFLRMAGTSAGAINTALITSIGKKQDAKSSKLLQYLCDLDFFSLVDGDKLVQWLIKTFITHKDFTSKVKLWITTLLAVFGLVVIGDFTFWQLGKHDVNFDSAANFCFTVTGIMLIAFIGIGVYVSTLLKKLKKEHYGLNPGDFFLNWVKDRMVENGVKTVTDLNNKASQLPHLSVKKPDTQDPTTLCGDVTFITSELVSGNKIEFPRMAKLFRANPDDLHPAEFVRASMSIPVFFRSHIIDNIQVNDPKIKEAWAETFFIDGNNEGCIPVTTRFVDGGILSNFPINIFYNPNIVVPRLPSFGIDLDDSAPGGDDGRGAANWPLMSYVGKMFNTVRYYYDKDFLIKNAVFKKGIGKIALAEFNWLNFFLSDDDKMKMFVRGAQAATAFLKEFDWNAYQQNRTSMQVELNKKMEQRTKRMAM